MTDAEWELLMDLAEASGATVDRDKGMVQVAEDATSFFRKDAPLETEIIWLQRMHAAALVSAP